MTIYAIRDATLAKAPHFFARDTLRFFHQTMESFKVYQTDHEGIYYITAPIHDREHRRMGTTQRWFYHDDLYNSIEDALEAKTKGAPYA